MTKKGIVAIVIAVVVIGFGAYWYSSGSSTPAAISAPVSTDTSSMASTNTVSDAALPANTDSSDASLGQDMTNIDAQMTGLGTDSASASAAAPVN